MDLTLTKVFILFGLLIFTSIAAMLPLLLIRKVEQDEEIEHKKRKKPKSTRGIMHTLKRWFPCCRHQRSRLLSRMSIKTTESHGDDGHEVHVHGKKTTMIMSILNCFAGGVFLGTSFLGLMPEVREVFDDVGVKWPHFTNRGHGNSSNSTTGEEDGEDLLPLTEIIVCCGLFLILIIEQTVHEILGWHNKKLAAKKAAQSTPLNLDNEETKMTASDSYNQNSSGLELQNVSSDGHNGTMVVSSCGNSPATVTIDHDHDYNSGQPTLQDEHDHHVVRSLILVVSLSLHSFLEGIAIGLQNQASSAVSIFVAVLLHKSLMAFSMGTSLVKAKQPKSRVIKAAIVFALMSPIGIAIGILMKTTSVSANTDMMHAVLQGIATGTFLYITFFEVLAREFEAHGYRIQKTIALLLGYVSIFLMVMTQHGT